MISRYFGSDRRQSQLHRIIDLTNMNVNLCVVDDSTYLCISYVSPLYLPHIQLNTPVLLFMPETTFTSIDSYSMEKEHYQSQVYLWFFVLRSITRLTFLPPTEEEAEFLPALPNCLWRHEYQINNGYLKEKVFAVEGFWNREDGIEVLHDDVLISTPLREMTEPRVRVCVLSHK